MPSRFPLINFYARKSPYEYTHPVRIEPTTLNLVGTRITYQATGDAMHGQKKQKKQYRQEREKDPCNSVRQNQTTIDVYVVYDATRSIGETTSQFFWSSSPSRDVFI